MNEQKMYITRSLGCVTPHTVNTCYHGYWTKCIAALVPVTSSSTYVSHCSLNWKLGEKVPQEVTTTIADKYCLMMSSIYCDIIRVTIMR